MPVRCLFLGKRMDDLTEATAMRGMLACGSITWYASPAIDQSFIQRGALVCVCVCGEKWKSNKTAISQCVERGGCIGTRGINIRRLAYRRLTASLSQALVSSQAAPFRSCERDCMAWHGACRKGTLMCGEPRCRYVTADAVSMYFLEQHIFAYMQS